jgi:hypothetical protein
MKIDKILVTPEIQEKILTKHGIHREEFEGAIFEGKPKFIRVKDNVYCALTHYQRYITVFFRYEDRNAHIITAYPSSEGQIRRYKKK